MITLRRLQYYDPEHDAMLNRFDAGNYGPDSMKGFDDPLNYKEVIAVASVKDWGLEAIQFATDQEVPFEVFRLVKRSVFLHPKSIGSVVWTG